jgi:MFS family permease
MKKKMLYFYIKNSLVFLIKVVIFRGISLTTSVAVDAFSILLSSPSSSPSSPHSSITFPSSLVSTYSSQSLSAGVAAITSNSYLIEWLPIKNRPLILSYTQLYPLGMIGINYLGYLCIDNNDKIVN